MRHIENAVTQFELFRNFALADLRYLFFNPNEISLISTGFIPYPNNGACFVFYLQNSENQLPILRYVFITDVRKVTVLFSKSVILYEFS